MIFHLTSPVNASDIAGLLCQPFLPDDFPIKRVTAFADLRSSALSFAPHCNFQPPKNSLVITSGPCEYAGNTLLSANPRLDFIRVLHWLKMNDLLPPCGPGHIDASAEIHPSAIIEAGATIGKECRIGAHSHIRSWVVLGHHVTVGSQVSLGHDGFGFEREPNGTPVRFPHLGRVIIGDHVEIGNLCAISRGNLANTEIQDHVKIDDQAYIAHNAMVCEQAMLMSGVRLNGRTRIGKGCWIGTGAMIKEGQTVGDHAVVGMGSVVLDHVAPDTTVAGNPARKIG
tara:strand:+ start:2226 stop:3077 length:852 start_codon:yes stop_codon:yes gene_type:complete